MSFVGSSISSRFRGAKLGQTLKIGGDEWRITGIFEADGSGFESEVWGDAEQVMQTLNRLSTFSSMTVRLNHIGDFDALQDAMDRDQRFQQIRIEREKEYYERQSQLMATFIRILGLVVTIIFSAGAMIGAMITMYASVANRTVEIGTLRALGFKRRSVLATFLLESIFLSLVGGLVGLLIASGLQFFTISTINFGTFAELAFSFSLSLDIALWALAFSIIMGVIGGFLPAARAARLDIVTALRAS